MDVNDNDDIADWDNIVDNIDDDNEPDLVEDRRQKRDTPWKSWKSWKSWRPYGHGHRYRPKHGHRYYSKYYYPRRYYKHGRRHRYHDKKYYH